MANEQLNSNEAKLHFIISFLSLDVKDIATKFGVTAGTISGWRKEYNGKEIKPMHLYALESAYGIPKKIFEDKNINTKKQIEEILKQQKQEEEQQLFFEHNMLIKSLAGEWFAYFYPSNSFADIHCIKTTISLDYTVIDEHQNRGKVFLGTNQSMIIKESKNSKNLVSITFDNDRIGYDIFPFSLVSKSNLVKREMFNFGFFTRTQLEPNIIKRILGDVSNMQLKVNCEFGERIAEYIEVVG